MVRRPTEMDRHVGGRVRMRRLMVKVSQAKLGSALNVAFQQIQKYENGTNRISASRLQQIAKFLGVPVDFFFDGAPEAQVSVEQAACSYETSLLTLDGLELLHAFHVIKERTIRQQLLKLLQALSESVLVQEGHLTSLEEAKRHAVAVLPDIANDISPISPAHASTPNVKSDPPMQM
jgi:transcriptional regulator with XRE-family HTH domain